EGIQGTGVLDDAADVEQGGLGQARVVVTGKLVDAVLGEGLVHVHAGAVVADQRLGHKGGGLAVGVGHVVYAVLEDLHFVGLFHQGVGAHADLTLAGGGHLVVVYFNFQAHGFHGVAHGAADVVQGVNRGH